MKKNIKLKQKFQKKYFSKEDIFLSRMASIIKVPQGVVKHMFTARTITTIRINPLKEDENTIYKLLRSKGVQLVPVEWSPNTYIVPNKDKSELGKMEEYDLGYFYIQNLSSLLPAVILEPKSNELILDMCAAPGSKTSQIAEMMGNKGKIVANDVDTWRIQKLTEVLEMFGVKNAEIVNEDGMVFGKREAGRFDKVLLDAPCSGEGMIYLMSMKSLRFWNIKKVKALTRIQKNLILSAYGALKPGGAMIYSTCTLEPDENEGVISELLKVYPKAKIQEIPLFDSEKFSKYKDHVKRGLISWNEKLYNKEVSKTYRILPSAEMMGFYIAKIVKE